MEELNDFINKCNEDRVDVNEIKRLIEEQRRNSIELKLEEAFANERFTFKFESRVWGEGLNRNLWRDGDTITFVEERPKLKGSQMISLGGMNAKAKKNDLISLFLRKESDL